MMFIIRSDRARPEARPEMAGVEIKLSRRAPAYVSDAESKIDFFCVGEPEAMAALHAAGWTVVELRDGYYEDGKGEGGGVAIWGQGRYWEIRADPFTVIDAVGPSGAVAAAAPAKGEPVEVRRAIFGA